MTTRTDPPYESWWSTIRASVVIALLVVAGVIVVAVIAWFAYHAWYVDTHCRMILGTQVCQ